MPLRFTRAWEDDRLDAEVLRVVPGERVLVVAAAGDTALAMAADGAHVTAVDREPDQLRLLRLKAAAARTLPPPTVYGWFEVGRDASAPSIYMRRVRDSLPAEDAEWWDRHIGMLATGLHTSSGVGRPFARLGSVLRLLQPGLAGEIEHTPDLATQAAWWRRHVRPRAFNRLTHGLAARTPVLSALAPNAAELRRMREGGWSYGLASRIDAVVASVLVRQHPWWRPAFAGRPADPGHGAAWLDAERLVALAASSHLTLVHGDLEAVLRQLPAGSLAAVSVSNVPDWVPAGATISLAQAVGRALAPGGRVLVRHVVDPGDDAFAAAGLVLDPVSEVLAARDRTALYERVNLYRQYTA